MNDFTISDHSARVFALLGRDYVIPDDAPGNFYLRLDHLGQLENCTIDVILPHYDEQRFFVEIYICGTMNKSYIFNTWEKCNEFLKEFEDKMYYYADLANKVAKNNKAKA
jgi:hypothetical protein